MLTDNLTATQAIMAEAVRAALEATSTIPAREEIVSENGMSDLEYDDMVSEIQAGWLKTGNAVAAILPAIMAHVVANGEVGIVKSDVTGATATQNNTGTGLIN